MPVRRLTQKTGEAADEGACRLVPVLPVRIRRQGRKVGEGGDFVPVGEALRALGRRQQADRVRAALRRDMVGDFAQEIDDRLLAEAPNLGGELARNRAAEALGAAVAAARPPLRVVDADVRRDDPRGLVPEDRIDAALEHPVGPLLAEVAVGGAVETGGRDAAPVVQHLALLGVERDPAALGLAAERATEAPRARQDGQPRRLRDRDDLRHRVAVVGEVVLGEGVEDSGVAPRGEVGHVPSHVARYPYAEVRAAGASGGSGHDQFTP